jgi:hypothetical protein
MSRSDCRRTDSLANETRRIESLIAGGDFWALVGRFDAVSDAAPPIRRITHFAAKSRPSGRLEFLLAPTSRGLVWYEWVHADTYF